MPEPRQQAIDFCKQNYSRFVEELKAFLSIPSISTDPERVAGYAARRRTSRDHA